MVRIRRGVVERDVASAAIGRRVRKGPVGVALSTLNRGVRTRQGEWGFRVIEGGAGPVGRAVADRAIRRESGLHVIRIGRGVVQRNVARTAICGRAGEHVVHVALSTLDTRMRSG